MNPFNRSGGGRDRSPQSREFDPNLRSDPRLDSERRTREPQGGPSVGQGQSQQPYGQVQEPYFAQQPRPQGQDQYPRPSQGGYQDPRFNGGYPQAGGPNLRPDYPPIGGNVQDGGYPSNNVYRPDAYNGPSPEGNSYGDPYNPGQQQMRPILRRPDPRTMNNPQFWREEEYDYRPQDPERYADKASPMRFIFAISGLIFIAAVSWFAYRWATSNPGEPPLIEAEEGPYKVRPENPGGINIPHQDKLIYGRISPGSDQPVEKLLPPQEQGSESQAYEAQNPYGAAHPQNQEVNPSGGTANPNYAFPAQAPQNQPSDAMTESNMASQNSGQQALQPIPLQTNELAVGTSKSQRQVSMGETSAAGPEKLAKASDENAKPKGAGPEATSKGGGSYYLQLATLPNTSQANAENDRLKVKFKKELSGIKTQVKSYDMPDGKKFRILAGPFKTKAAASAKCSEMGSNCRVTHIP